MFYLSGDKRTLLQYEHRWYTDWDWFQLARVGIATYVDIGKLSGSGLADESLLTDLGVGLRLMSSRAFVRNILHIDLAFPTSHQQKTDKWILSFIIKEHF